MFDFIKLAGEKIKSSLEETIDKIGDKKNDIIDTISTTGEKVATSLSTTREKVATSLSTTGEKVVTTKNFYLHNNLFFSRVLIYENFLFYYFYFDIFS